MFWPGLWIAFSERGEKRCQAGWQQKWSMTFSENFDALATHIKGLMWCKNEEGKQQLRTRCSTRHVPSNCNSTLGACSLTWLQKPVRAWYFPACLHLFFLSRQLQFVWLIIQPTFCLAWGCPVRWPEGSILHHTQGGVCQIDDRPPTAQHSSHNRIRPS